MAHQDTSEFLQLFNSVKAGSLKKNWQTVWASDEQLEEVVENIDDLIYFAVLAMPYKEVGAIESFIGKLAIAKVLLPNVKDNDGTVAQFETIGRSLEDAVSQMLLASPAVKDIVATFEKGGSLEKSISQKPDSEQSIVGLMTLSALMLLSDIDLSENQGCCADDEECDEDCD